MSDTPKIISPEYGGSGEGHWLTHWEASSSDYDRITPKSFDRPDLYDWLDALENTVAIQSSAPILVAHSLGCLLVAEYLHRSKANAAGVSMVAVPNPDGPNSQ
ncbi:alpha/beta hydrolase [Pseudophaeobacter sp.]|uniref:RBBP9/YdeN family alpha/beta hydrolase n=1 Tax=Pseudophaeobacter sp. TaxID=1971739 RepID=UPI0032969955